MPNIDELTVKFSSSGATKAIKNIKAMADAVEILANKINIIDPSKLTGLVSGMETIKKSIPTKGQAENLKLFADAVSALSNAIGSANNIGGFAQNMADLRDATKGFGKTSGNTIQNAVQAMANFSQQAKQANKNVQQMNKNNGKQKQAPTFNMAQFNSLVKTLDKVEVKARGIFSKILVPTKQFKSLENAAENTRKKYEEVRNAMQQALQSGQMTMGSKAFDKQQAQLDGLRTKYDELILKQKELALSGGGFKIDDRITGTLNSFAQGFKKTLGWIKSFVSWIGRASRSVASFAKHLFSAVKAANKTIFSGKGLTNLSKKLSSEFLRLGKMLKLMVTRMALRKVIAEVGNGFKSLALHSEQFNNSVSNVMNASKQLGYSFASMVSPLINALAPAIVYVINLLTKLLNVINQVFSALTGATTWNKAKKFTDNWADSIREAGGSASKAAKEIKKTVLGFDELNQLQDNKDSGGGGGAGGITDMFDTVDIDPKWKDFADWLKKMWEDKNFYDLGKLAGEKLRDFLESIPWDKIRQTSNDLGKCLASFINGFVEVKRLGYDIGYTLAQALNTVFEFVNGFVHELHWDSVGKFIADMFNGFFETIDWDLIKDTVVTGLAGLAEAIQNFIDTFHWDNISDFVINGLDVITSGIKAFIEGIDFKDLGSKIGEQLQKILGNKETWRNIGETIGEMIQAAIDFASNFIDEINIDDIRQSLKELVDGFFDKVDTEEAGRTIGKIINKLVELIKGFWEDNGDTIKQEVKKFFGALFDEVDVSELIGLIMPILGAALAGGVLKAVAFVIKEVAKIQIWKLLFGGITGGSGGVSSLTAFIIPRLAYAFQTIGTFITNAVSGIGALLSGTVGTILAGIAGSVIAFFGGAELGKVIGWGLFPDDAELYEHYQGITGTLELLRDTADAVWYEVSEAAKLFAERTSEHWGEFKDFFSKTTGDVTEASKLLAERTGEHLTDLKDGAKKKLDEIKEAARTFAERTGEHWNNAKEKVATFATDTKAKFEDIKGKYESFKTETVKKVSEFASEAKTKFDNAKENIEDFKEQAKDKFDTFKSNLETFRSDSATKLSEFGSDIKEKFADAKANLETFKTDAKALLDETKQNFDDFKSKIAEALSVDNWTFSGVADGLKKTFEKAKDAVKDIWNGIAEKLNGEHEVGSSKIKINLPKFAKGGFPEDGLFMANHNELVGSFSNGKTAVANNSQIISGIERGVYNAMVSASRNQNSSYIANEIVVDGDVIARTITKAQEKQNRRFSPSTG